MKYSINVKISDNTIAEFDSSEKKANEILQRAENEINKIYNEVEVELEATS